MYALVEIKGRQYKAQKGDVIRVDLYSLDKGSAVELDTVMMISDDNGVKVGAPYLNGVKIMATVEDHTKGEKVVAFKFKRRKSYRKKIGHRQKYTLLKVEDILGVK